ncbi:ABC transporter permease [Rhizohabitans arisaemae]|uniref:ABC transporter permease n=1 Tax=Rhizohabitans arisaemae TaxID=2720610 RepID=UPI0024B10323|nr:ABC transporter permease [Rhizohabitans arisaemae]
MVKYVGTRLLEAVPVLLAMSVLAFLLIHLVPGDPVRIAMGTLATDADIATRRQELGLEAPLLDQYLRFVSGALHLDFGTSIKSGESVGELVARRIWPSVLLVGSALSLSALFSIGLGALAAAKRGTWADQLIRAGLTITFVTPPFWLALLLILVVSIEWRLLPTSGFGSTFGGQVQSIVLPALTMALALTPVLLRLLRSQLIETLQSDYVEAARSRRLPWPRILFKHALRPSLGASLSVWGYLFAVSLSSSVVVEKIFAIPGLGSLLVEAVGGRDYPVIQAVTLVMGAAVVVGSLLTDIVHVVVDPRVRA